MTKRHELVVAEESNREGTIGAYPQSIKSEFSLACRRGVQQPVVRESKIRTSSVGSAKLEAFDLIAIVYRRVVRGVGDLRDIGIEEGSGWQEVCSRGNSRLYRAPTAYSSRDRSCERIGAIVTTSADVRGKTVVITEQRLRCSSTTDPTGDHVLDRLPNLSHRRSLR